MASERSLPGLLAALLIPALLLSPAASAAPTPEDKETARHLMKVGDQKLASKDYASALRAYETAHSIMGVPTTGVAVAKARIELRQLIEAREILLEIARSPKEPTEPAVFTEARREAASLSQDLEGRIPSLVITVQGPDPAATAEITVDGRPVPAAGLGTTRKVNPGPHAVTAAARGFAPSTAKVDVAERESRPVLLRLTPGDSEDDDFTVRPATADPFAVHREGPRVGLAGGPMMLLPLDGGVLFGVVAGMVLNVGVTPKIDIRTGAFASFHAGEYKLLHLGGPLAVRYNFTSRFAVSAGLVAGFATTFSRDSGFTGGPEWSLLSVRLGEKREYELDFSQGLRFGDTPVEYHNGFVLTYLFLDD